MGRNAMPQRLWATAWSSSTSQSRVLLSSRMASVSLMALKPPGASVSLCVAVRKRYHSKRGECSENL